MSECVYNNLGEDISSTRTLLLSDDFGYVDDNNIPHINWGSETELCDCNGFDKSYRPQEGVDIYVIKDYIIPKGTIICRYGYSNGIFTTLKGTDYSTLGLPYVENTIEYHEYKVSEDLLVECYVTKGKVAPKFLSQGGAVQFMHKQSIALECEDGYIEEDFTWIQKNA